MADIGTIAIIVEVAIEIKSALERVPRNRQRLRLLYERVEWFVSNITQVSQKSNLRQSDLVELRKFEALLKEVLDFVRLSDTKGWLQRLWRNSSDKDAIDTFNERIDRFRSDWVFMFVTASDDDKSSTQNPLPPAQGKFDWEDFQQLLEDLTSGDGTIKAELLLANIPKDKAIAVVQRKLNESKARSELSEATSTTIGSATQPSTATSASVSTMSTSDAGSITSSFATLKMLKPEHFRPNLRVLSKEKHPEFVIGDGAFGTVFKCVWETRGFVVAVKVLKCKQFSKKAEESLRREVEIMTNLFHHDNVIDIFGSYSDPAGNFALMMSYASGGSLRDRLDRADFATVPWSQKWIWIEGIAKGMAWLHSADPPIIHRDLKSDNILLGERGEARVSDFGCAIAKSETSSKLMSATDSTAGSLPWIPPEAFIDGTQAAAGDVYAFAIVMWEIATGQLPWPGINSGLISNLVKDGQRPNLKSILGDDEYVALMQRCWHQNPASRPPFMVIMDELSCRVSPQQTIQISASKPPSLSLRERMEGFKDYLKSKWSTGSTEKQESKTKNVGSSSATKSLTGNNNASVTKPDSATSSKPTSPASFDEFALEDVKSTDASGDPTDIEQGGTPPSAAKPSDLKVKTSTIIQEKSKRELRRQGCLDRAVHLIAICNNKLKPKEKTLITISVLLLTILIIVLAAVLGSRSDGETGAPTLRPTQAPSVQPEQTEAPSPGFNSQILLGSDAGGNSGFGSQVALSRDGKTAAVTSVNEFGAMWIFKRSNNGVWTQQGPKLVGDYGDLISPPQTGFQVALNDVGNVAVVGTTSPDHGLVPVFRRNGETWTQETLFTMPGFRAERVALSSDGMVALVGGGNEQKFLPKIFFYGNETTPTTWTASSPLDFQNQVFNSVSRYAVALSSDGSIAFIGERHDNDNRGALWAFQRQEPGSSSWLPQSTKLVGTGGVGQGFQGFHVALSANGLIALSSGPEDNSAKGALWTFVREESSWIQSGDKFVVSDGERLGESLALSAAGDVALVTVQIQEFAQVLLLTRAGSTWQSQQLVIPHREPSVLDYFSVALSANAKTALIGNSRNGTSALLENFF